MAPPEGNQLEQLSLKRIMIMNDDKQLKITWNQSLMWKNIILTAYFECCCCLLNHDCGSCFNSSPSHFSWSLLHWCWEVFTRIMTGHCPHLAPRIPTLIKPLHSSADCQSSVEWLSIGQKMCWIVVTVLWTHCHQCSDLANCDHSQCPLHWHTQLSNCISTDMT